MDITNQSMRTKKVISKLNTC